MARMASRIFAVLSFAIFFANARRLQKRSGAKKVLNERCTGIELLVAEWYPTETAIDKVGSKSHTKFGEWISNRKIEITGKPADLGSCSVGVSMWKSKQKGADPLNKEWQLQSVPRTFIMACSNGNGGGLDCGATPKGGQSGGPFAVYGYQTIDVSVLGSKERVMQREISIKFRISRNSTLSTYLDVQEKNPAGVEGEKWGDFSGSFVQR